MLQMPRSFKHDIGKTKLIAVIDNEILKICRSCQNVLPLSRWNSFAVRTASVADKQLVISNDFQGANSYIENGRASHLQLLDYVDQHLSKLDCRTSVEKAEN